MNLKSILGAVKKDSITVFIFRGAEEIKKIYFRSLTLKLLGFLGILILLCILLLIIGVIFLSKSNESLKTQIASLESISSQKDKTIERLRTESRALIRNDKYQDQFTDLQKRTLEDIDSENLDIDNISITPDNTDSFIQVSFMLNNIQKEKMISGYVTIIGFSETFDTNAYSSYPAAIKLNNDYIPVNYKYGERFSIQRFKTIRASLVNLQTSNKIKFIVIALYSTSGEILLRKILDI